MFNKEDEKKEVLVTMKLADGRTLKGNLLLPKISTLSRQLNNDSYFYDFADLEGNLCFIAKSSISEVAPAVLPKAAAPEATKFDETTSPHKALGLSPDASPADIEAAFANLSAQYDAAKFANADLPEEINRYLTAKRAQLGAAYKFLTGAGDETDVAA